MTKWPLVKFKSFTKITPNTVTNPRTRIILLVADYRSC